MTNCVAGLTEEPKMMRALLAASLCAGWALHGIEPAHAHAHTPARARWGGRSPPGGPPDGRARTSAARLGAVLGQKIGGEHRGGGAGASIGAKFAPTPDPDGYTVGTAQT